MSLSAEDVAFIDVYAVTNRIESRSEVLREAVRLLRASELEAVYESAWQQWVESGVAKDWDGMTGDGLTDAERCGATDGPEFDGTGRSKTLEARQKGGLQ